jgi:hypothetical protein
VCRVLERLRRGKASQNGRLSQVRGENAVFHGPIAVDATVGFNARHRTRARAKSGC